MKQMMLIPGMDKGDSQSRRPAGHGKRRRRRLEALAYHESGHAAILILAGLPFRRISVVPDDRILGGIAGEVEREPDPSHDSRWTLSDWAVWEILVSMAGLVAEARLTGRRNWSAAGFDFCNAVDWAYRLDPTIPAMTARIEGAYLAVAELLREDRPPWRAVQALAGALVDRRELTAARALRIARDAGLVPPGEPTSPSIAPGDGRKLDRQARGWIREHVEVGVFSHQLRSDHPEWFQPISVPRSYSRMARDGRRSGGRPVDPG